MDDIVISELWASVTCDAWEGKGNKKKDQQLSSNEGRSNHGVSATRAPMILVTIPCPIEKYRVCIQYHQY